MTKKRPLSWLGCILAAAGSLALLSILTSQSPKRATIVPIPESLPSARSAGHEPVAATSGGTTVADHAAARPKATATLSELLADNERLIEVIGVFTAVSVFTGQLGIRWFAYALSFLFMTFVVILCVELRTKFPSDTDSLKVMLFEDILTLAVLLLLLYFFVDYRGIWKYFLVFPIFGAIFCAVFFGFVVPVLRRSALHKNKKLFELVATVIVIVLAYFSLRLAILVEPGVNRFLDTLNKMVSGWTH